MRTKLTKKERTEILCYCAMLNDKELLERYFEIEFSTLGTQTDQMYDLGYDLVDIREQARYEEYLGLKLDLYEEVCRKRGIKLRDDDK